MVPSDHASLLYKPGNDRFIRFYATHRCAKHTDRQNTLVSDRVTDFGSYRPHLTLRSADDAVS